MGSVLDKVRRLKASRPVSGGNSRMRGIFHNWRDGDNTIRLAGEFVEVHTHFIAPAPKRQERGLCRMDVFQGDHKMPQVINCADWDITTETAKKAKTCLVCRLRAIARSILKENPTKEEKDFFEALISLSSPRTNLKWNVIDRDDPYVTVVDDGQERRVIGFKIATIGMEAWKDIDGIFDQCGFDISDPDAGVDIKVTKGSNGARTVYTAQAVIEGVTLKVTPFTEEEKALQLHDLKAICGKQVENDSILAALHEDLRTLLEQVSAPDEGAELTEEAEAAETAVIDEAPSVPATPPPRPTPVAAPAKPVVAPTAPAKPVVAAPVRSAATAPVRPSVAPARPVAAPVRPTAAPAKPVVPAARAVPAAAKPPVAVQRPAPKVEDAKQALEDAIVEGDSDGIPDAEKKR